jgi:hypothetical protein
MKTNLIRIVAAFLLFSAAAAQAAQTMVMYKRASCGCCSVWGDHIRAHGFSVNAINVADPGVFREKYGVRDTQTCHTAVIDGYVIDGHVPAREVKRLLAEKPKAKGIVVPGMPAGSPGMEGGNRKDPFNVFLVLPDGSYRVYASYGR